MCQGTRKHVLTQTGACQGTHWQTRLDEEPAKVSTAAFIMDAGLLEDGKSRNFNRNYGDSGPYRWSEILEPAR